MHDQNPALIKVLKAREDRAEIRSKIAQGEIASVSLTLNIPGYPKHNHLTELFFKELVNDLKIVLAANRIQILKKEELNIIDEAGHFYILGLSKTTTSLTIIKKITEVFENSHTLGRIVDADVFDQNGKPVSSGKKKACIICANKSAVECMREQNHEHDELRTFIFDKLQNYLTYQRAEFIKRKLSEIAAKSLLYEVSLAPKPGLVDFNSSGAHSDMNYYTFLNSSSAISQYWYLFAEAGLKFNDNLSKALPIVRQIGLKAEQAMFSATGNVNTQKGLIFLLGLSAFTTAYLFKETNIFDEILFRKTIKEICNNLIETELINTTSEANTHGEETFKKYGLQGAGVRFEAQNGFPIVFNEALPYLDKELIDHTLLDKEKTDIILTTCLLKIISTLNDSNVLYRKGLKKSEELKEFALLVLKNKKSYTEFCDRCQAENISPGGSADMLALALFFYFVKHELILNK